MVHVFECYSARVCLNGTENWNLLHKSEQLI